jgi:tripartite ATP-independent transporter DctP family solute receptor
VRIRSNSLLFILALWIVTACGSQKRVKVLKLGHGLDPEHPVHQAMLFMAQQLSEKSSGTMHIDIYPSQQLGTERECLELLQIGSMGMTKVSASVLESFAHAFKVFSLPYIFRDEAHKFKIYEGKIGKQLLLGAEKYWLRGLCFYDAGSRSFYTKDRPVYTPEDLSNLKIRTQESATSMRLVNAMGASATPISWGELYTALQQGVVDGAENNPPSFYTSHHYEVCKYYCLNEHTAVPDVLIISTIVWNTFSKEERNWLQQAADTSAQYQKKIWKKASDEALKKVQDAGVEIIIPDKKPFMDKVSPLYEEYRSQEEIYAIIQAIKGVE